MADGVCALSPSCSGVGGISTLRRPSRQAADMTIKAEDALPRPEERSEVLGQSMVTGRVTHGSATTRERGAADLGSRRSVGAGGAMGVVVRCKDSSLARPRRRCHRARPAARRHARKRRSTMRCEAAKARLLAGSRSTAPAAQPETRCIDGRSLWHRSLAALRWRRMQAVWVHWMASGSSPRGGPRERLAATSGAAGVEGTSTRGDRSFAAITSAEAATSLLAERCSDGRVADPMGVGLGASDEPWSGEGPPKARTADMAACTTWSGRLLPGSADSRELDSS